MLGTCHVGPAVDGGMNIQRGIPIFQACDPYLCDNVSCAQLDGDATEMVQ